MLVVVGHVHELQIAREHTIGPFRRGANPTLYFFIGILRRDVTPMFHRIISEVRQGIPDSADSKQIPLFWATADEYEWKMISFSQ